MKKNILTAMVCLATVVMSAQVCMTTKCTVSFFSKTAMENIDAVNEKSKAIVNPATGGVAIQLLNTQFEFKSSLMQEHFNENYMESEKYPISVFKGNIVDKVDFSKPGTYNVDVAGKLNMHGVEKECTVPVTLTVTNASSFKAETKFKVKISDYKIKIPSVVGQNIAEEIEISFSGEFAPVKK